MSRVAALAGFEDVPGNCHEQFEQMDIVNWVTELL